LQHYDAHHAKIGDMLEAARSHQFRHLRTGHGGKAALPRERGKHFLSKQQCMAKHRFIVNKKAIHGCQWRDDFKVNSKPVAFVKFDTKQ
jgi:hypothetical protein